jgi:hypothetical protein
MEYAENEFCVIFITFGICNSRAGTAVREHPLHYPDNIIQTLCFDG